MNELIKLSSPRLKLDLVWELMVQQQYLQITCFSFGSFESRWNVAFVSLYYGHENISQQQGYFRLTYFFEFCVAGTRNDIS